MYLKHYIFMVNVKTISHEPSGVDLQFGNLYV